MAFKSRVQFDGMNDDVTFWLIEKNYNGTHRRAVIEWQEYAPGDLVDPTLAARWAGDTNRDLLQAVVDAAYEAGIRPTAADVRGETNALRAHIADLKHVAFSLLPQRVTTGTA